MSFETSPASLDASAEDVAAGAAALAGAAAFAALAALAALVASASWRSLRAFARSPSTSVVSAAGASVGMSPSILMASFEAARLSIHTTMGGPSFRDAEAASNCVVKVSFVSASNFATIFSASAIRRAAPASAAWQASSSRPLVFFSSSSADATASPFATTDAVSVARVFFQAPSSSSQAASAFFSAAWRAAASSAWASFSEA
mmetsp:Transcript_13451/g.28098  ORF Transcript_13451/g.28098 Transcript_13451/m.28098 type:complete len:203 (-) Transcript_13451:168-776(-)